MQGVDRPSNDTGRLLVKTAANLGLRAEWDASNEETRKRAAQATAQGCFEEAERLSTFDKSWARIRDLSYNTHQHPHPHKTTTQHTCMRASLELTLVLPSNVQSQNRFFSASAHSETVIFWCCRERLLAALAANFMRMCDEGTMNYSAILVLQRLYGGTDTEKAELLRAAAQVRTEEMQEETTAEAGHQARFSVVDVKDALGRTPLQLAVETQQPVVVATLLAAGASAEARDHDGNTVLMAAVFKGNAECVKALLRFKGFDRHTLTHKRSLQPDIEARGAHGRTALIFAARPVVCSLTHSLKIISLQYVPWVEHHTLPSRVSMYHAPCVFKPSFSHAAVLLQALRGASVCTHVLLEKGADAGAADRQGLTALMWAVKGGHIECVRELLVRASPSPPTCRRAVTRVAASLVGVLGTQSSILTLRESQEHAGATAAMVDARSQAGMTALNMAAAEGQLECLALDPKIWDPDGLKILTLEICIGTSVKFQIF